MWTFPFLHLKKIPASFAFKSWWWMEGIQTEDLFYQQPHHPQPRSPSTYCPAWCKSPLAGILPYLMVAVHLLQRKLGNDHLSKLAYSWLVRRWRFLTASVDSSVVCFGSNKFRFQRFRWENRSPTCNRRLATPSSHLIPVVSNRFGRQILGVRITDFLGSKLLILFLTAFFMSLSFITIDEAG